MQSLEKNRETLENMADHIPFITGQETCKLVVKHYSDSEYARVPLDRAVALLSQIPKLIKTWIDPSVDGLDNLDARRSTSAGKNEWFEFIKHIPNFEQIGKPEFHSKPDLNIVKDFV